MNPLLMFFVAVVSGVPAGFAYVMMPVYRNGNLSLNPHKVVIWLYVAGFCAAYISLLWDVGLVSTAPSLEFIAASLMLAFIIVACGSFIGILCGFLLGVIVRIGRPTSVG